MARLIYFAIASLDECVEDGRGTFDWAAPDAQVLAAVNELERPIGDGATALTWSRRLGPARDG